MMTHPPQLPMTKTVGADLCVCPDTFTSVFRADKTNKVGYDAMVGGSRKFYGNGGSWQRTLGFLSKKVCQTFVFLFNTPSWMLSL